MKKEYVQALVRAHARGDNDAFRRVALLVAAELKRANERDEIRRLVEREPQLPREVGSIWTPVETAERPWFPPEVAACIEEVLEMFRYRVELAARGIRPVTRLLLVGPPGCGKTMTSRWFAAHLELSAYVLRISATLDGFVGGTSAKIAKALDSVARVPAVWVFDELDALTSSRTSDHAAASKEYSSIVNSWCIELDKLGVASGLLVGTTNRLDIIDPAIVRRFDVTIEWPAPTPAHLEGFARHVGGRPCATYAETFVEAETARRRAAIAEIRAGAQT